jgi:phenylalanyl-tRNA synthetase beta chain
VREPHRVAALAVGPLAAASWRGGGEAADLFALKGALEALAGQLGTELAFGPGEQPFLHPGRAASVGAGGVEAGWIGELHPLVCRAWDLDAAVAVELDLAPLLAAAGAGEETFEDVTAFPAVHQDIAVVVPHGVPAEEVRSAVLAAAGELLRGAAVFDLYEGEQVGEGRKSLALRLEFRAADRTLTDAEVAERRAAIEAGLKEIGGSLRG